MSTTERISFTIADSSLGTVLVARGIHGLRAVLLGDDAGTLRLDLQTRFPKAALVDEPNALRALAASVIALVESPRRRVDLPLHLDGTRFQREVWTALREIPAGTTSTYSEIAMRIGRPGAVRAVGGACAANALAVVVPCHRAVRGDGRLAGYRWGLDRKRALLDREASGGVQQ